MAEEQRCQEGHRLCANNCGFFGSPATHDLCSKCFRDLRLKEERSSSAKLAVKKSLASSAAATTTTSSSSSTAAFSTPLAVVVLESTEEGRSETAAVVDAPPAAPAVAASESQPGRCGTCRRRVGLTGFKCRCGMTFCGGHRYPEKHGCTFDYKAAGRDAIAKANPLVVADKLHKI